MIDSLNICLPCGLCCDGTLIGFVQLQREELPVMRKLMDITEDNNIGFFLQPCEKHSSGICSIYSQRPKQCNNFNCGLLESLERKELDFDSALEVINMVKQKRMAIEKKLVTLDVELKYKSFFFKILELRKIIRKNNSDSSLTQKHEELISEIDELNKLLSISFGISLY